MKSIFLVLLSTLLFSSCIGTKGINEVVQNKYSKALKRPLKGENFAITNPIAGGQMVQTKKIKKVVIPAFFYWKFQSVYESDINPYVPINLFNKYADDYAATLNFKNKLANRKVELNVVFIPKSFQFSQTSKTIFLLIAAVNSESNSIKSLSSELKIDYKLMDGSQVAGSGSILITDADIAQYNQQLSLSKRSNMAAKKFIANYLDTYDNYIYLMSKAFVDKLYQKL